MVVKEGQELPVCAEVQFEIVGEALREFGAQAKHYGVVYFNPRVLGGKQAPGFQLVGIGKMQVVVFQRQQVFRVDVPVELGKGVDGFFVRY